jgi:hypothetical protein
VYWCRYLVCCFLLLFTIVLVLIFGGKDFMLLLLMLELALALEFRCGVELLMMLLSGC